MPKRTPAPNSPPAPGATAPAEPLRRSNPGTAPRGKGTSGPAGSERRSLEQYRSLFQNMQEGFAHCRLLYEDGRATDFLYIETNKAFEEITGLKDAVGRRAREFVPDLAWSGVPLLEAYVRVARTGKPEQLDFYHQGLGKWLVISAYSPAPEEFVTVVQDHTEATNTERALRESEQSFRSLFENATLGLYRTTPDGRILMANPALLQMLGYDSLDELAARNLEQGGYEPRYGRSEFKARLAESDVIQGLESAWKRRDGSTIFVRESARIVRDGAGKDLYYEGVVEDVSERREAERALSEEQDLMKTIIDSLPENVFIKDRQGRIILDNAAHRKFLGRENVEDVRGKTDRDFFTADLAARFEADERQIIESGRAMVNYEEEAVDSAGRRRWLLTTKVPVRSPGGAVSGIVGINTDITERKEAEDALRLNEQKFRTIFDGAADAIFILDAHNQFIEVNRVACERLGYGRDELLGQTPARFDTPEQAALVGGRIKRVLETGSGTFETAMVARDGRVIPTEINARMIEYEGRPALLSLARDISERKKAGEALRESEEKFRLLAEQSPNMIFINKRGRLVYANTQCEEVLGYSRAELCAPDFDFLTLIAPDSTETVKSSFQRHGRGLEVPSYEYALLTRTGKRIEAINSTRLIQYEGEVAILGVATDISARKEAEARLREMGRRQEAILAAVPDIIMEVDKGKVYTWANQAGHEFFGPGVVGRQASAYFEGEQDTYAKVEPLLRGEVDLFYVESWQRRRDGAKRLLGWWCKTLRDSQGQVTGVLSTARDITPQKEAELALRQSEQKFRDLVENINDVIYNTTLEGRILYLSPAVERLLGFAPEELLGLDFFSFVNPEDRPAIEEALADILQGRLYPSDYRLRKKDGTFCWVRTSSRIVQSNENGPALISGVLVDLTERKKAEEDLRVSEEKFHYFFDNSPVGKSITSISGELSVNKAFCRMLGYSEEELKQRNWREITHPDDLAASQKMADELLSGKAQSSRIIKRYLHKDGSAIWVDVSTSLRRDAEGRPQYFMASILDITERKRAEDSLRESEARLSSIIDNLQDAYFRADVAGRLTLASPSALKMYGYDSLDDLIGLRAEELYGDPQDRTQMFVRLQSQDRLNDHIGLGRRRDGSTFWASMNVRLLRDEAGKVVGSEGVVRDISERRRAEEELERHRLHLEELVRERTAQLDTARLSLERVLHSAGEGIFGIDIEGRMTFMNESGASMLGWSIEDLVGRPAHETFHVEESEEDETRVSCPITQTARTGVAHSRGDARFRRKDGSVFSVEYQSSPLGGMGSLQGAVVVFRDATDRNRTEEERKKHMEELERFNRAMVDREKRIIEIKEEVNRLCQELGREPKYPPVWK